MYYITGRLLHYRSIITLPVVTDATVTKLYTLVEIGPYAYPQRQDVVCRKHHPPVHLFSASMKEKERVVTEPFL